MIPLVGTLLSAGLPTIANSIVELLTDSGEAAVKTFIKDKTGLDLTGAETKLSKEQLSALRTAEDELAFEAEENRHEEAIFAKEVEDIQNARDMNRELSHSEDKFLSRFVPTISLFILISGFGYLAGVTFLDIPPENNQTVLSTIEFVKVIMTMTASFWLGTSFSSSKKDRHLFTSKNKFNDLEKDLNLF